MSIIDQAEQWNEARDRKATDALFGLLNQHHNFNLFPPKEWVKREPRSKEWFSILPDSAGPSIENIKLAVAMHFDVTLRELASARRSQKIARSRQSIMYLARELTGKSFPVIGRELNRDHTSVIHGARVIEGLIRENHPIARDIAALRQALA